MKKIKLLVMKYFFQILYFLFSKFCFFHSDRVVLATNRNTQIFSGLKKLNQIFQEQSNYEVKIIAFKFERSLLGRIKYFYYSILSVHALATSKFFIVDDYFFPIYCINKQEKNIVVQIWHAIGHLKRFGLSIEKNRNQVIRPHSNYTFAVVNSRADIPFYAEAFGMDERNILPLGSPKIDSLSETTITTLKKSKPIILYAPTYRKTNEENLKLLDTFIDRFKELTFKFDIYISLHPYVRFGDRLIDKNFKIFQDGNFVEDVLSSTDILITDYSSVLLEFLYFEKPLLIYAPDYDNYADEFGFYVDFKNYIDAPFFEDIKSLFQYVSNGEYSESTNSIIEMKEKVFDYYDGQNSQRLFEFLTNNNGGYEK
ncbi:CDP-glycerol glycerophosphotransferase family protein [Enterococcus gallinarum]|uniref:CDP-glycerol glycerophosphotransferase family protein n=2 Tax=Enterococcus gallinarum TaxID=1353 RepID=UPI0031379036